MYKTVLQKFMSKSGKVGTRYVCIALTNTEASLIFKDCMDGAKTSRTKNYNRLFTSPFRELSI
jgi:hypothetical protein